MTLEVVSPTSVVLSWYPLRLEYWNGVVVNYTVEINLIGPAGSPNEGIAFTEFHSIPLPAHPLTNNADPRLAVLPLQPETYQANMLHEFHVYSFVVYMYNAAGRSNPSHTIFQEMPGTGITLQITFKVLISCVFVFYLSQCPLDHQPTYKLGCCPQHRLLSHGVLQIFYTKMLKLLDIKSHLINQ